MPTYINDNEDIWTFARIVNPQQQAIIQTDVESVAYSVYDQSALAYTGGSAPYVVVSNSSVGVSGVVMNTLMTDYGWAQDGIGYNFRHRIPASVLSMSGKGGHTFKIEYVLTSSNAVSTQDWDKMTIVKYVTLSPIQTS